MTPPRIVFVVFPGFQILDLTGPHEVFAQVAGLTSPYQLEILAPVGGTVRSGGGITITSDGALDACTGTIDTLVVVGGPGRRAAVTEHRFVAALADAAARSRRIASVCSGAFLLAAAGLLDGRRATTHWSSTEELAAAHPAVAVETDPIFVRDGPVWTSAGVTAGIDLALALVEDDLGAPVARELARRLVMFVQRPGGQAQFSTQLAVQRPTSSALRDLQNWIADHLTGDLSVPALAARTGMSDRHFARVFAAQTGLTPAAYVQAARMEAARRLLESTDTTVEATARACGFGTVETMHRCFRRTVRVTPGQYRHHFS